MHLSGSKRSCSWCPGQGPRAHPLPCWSCRAPSRPGRVQSGFQTAVDTLFCVKGLHARAQEMGKHVCVSGLEEDAGGHGRALKPAAWRAHPVTPSPLRAVGLSQRPLTRPGAPGPRRGLGRNGRPCVTTLQAGERGNQSGVTAWNPRPRLLKPGHQVSEREDAWLRAGCSAESWTNWRGGETPAGPAELSQAL